MPRSVFTVDDGQFSVAQFNIIGPTPVRVNAFQGRVRFGTSQPKGGPTSDGVLLRFAVDLPAGVNIRGAAISLTPQVTTLGPEGTRRFGWLQPDGTSEDLAVGIDTYTTDFVPPRHDLDEIVDLTRYVGSQSIDVSDLWEATANVQFRAGENIDVGGSPVDYEIGEDFVTRLEESLAINEEFRLLGEVPAIFYADALPELDGNFLRDTITAFRFAPTDALATGPELLIDWDPIGEATLTASASIDARGHLGGGADIIARATVDLRAVIDHEIRTELSGSAQITANGLRTVVSGIEISGSALLEALLINVFEGAIPFPLSRAIAERVGTVTRPAAAGAVQRPQASAAVDHPIASATVQRSASSATIQKPPPSSSINRPGPEE